MSAAAISTADVERMKAILAQRIRDAEATRATAMLAEVWRVQLAELEAVDVADGSAGSPASQPERLLSANEMAARLGLSRKALYARAATLPFTRRVGKRTLRFSETGFQQWAAKGRHK